MANNAAKPHVVHAGVDHLRLTRRWTITQAVVGSAEVRAAFDNLARNPELRLRGIVTLGGRGNARINGRAAAGFDDFVGVARDKPITRPFPYVTCHIVQTVTVRRKGSDGRRALVAVAEQVLPGELSLPTIGHHLAAGRMLIAPSKLLSVKPAASGKLPLRFGRQFFPGPVG